MADSREIEEDSASRPSVVNDASSDDDDVHFCGKCKLSFTDLSKYIQHKRDKACRDSPSKSTLTKVVEKLPIHSNPPNKPSPEKTRKSAKDASEVVDKRKDRGAKEKGEASPEGETRVEVQFLEPLVASGSGGTPSKADDDVFISAKVPGSSEKPSNRRKRKSSTPKTTRKRKASSTNQANETSEQHGKQSPALHPQGESVTVHIPESQLVHLNSGSKKAPSTPQGAGVRIQGATSVFVPIYLTPPSKVYKCLRCPAEFKTQEEKDEHNKMHKKEFRCMLCAKSFFTASGLDQHRENETHSHPCEQCGKVFSSVVNLRKHKTTHSTDRPFACDQCEKCFCSSANLASHKRTVHVTEKKHKCPECGKAFARRDKMTRHSLIHYPDTRPTFVCPFRSHSGCMKTFYREDKLKRHLFTHSNDKPFKCELCQKGYARRDNLNDHMRTHTGQYSHLCRFCSKGFVGPHKLNRHVKSAHKDKWTPGLAPDPLDTQPPTMVPRNTTTPPQASRGEYDASSPEALSDVGADDGFDASASGSADEPTSEEEPERDEEQSIPKPPTPQLSRPVTTPQGGARPVSTPQSSARRVTSQQASTHPSQIPQVTSRSVLNPQVSAHPGPTPPVNARRVPSPQVSAHSLPTPQGNAHSVPNPQGSARRVPSPQGSARRVPSPQVSAHSVPAPQVSAHPRPISQVSTRPGSTQQTSVHPETIPQVSVHPRPIPQLSVRPGPIPQLSARPGPLPQARARPIQSQQVGGVPQPFIPPTLQPGLNASAELLAFTHELFSVVGRFQP